MIAPLWKQNGTSHVSMYSLYGPPCGNRWEKVAFVKDICGCDLSAYDMEATVIKGTCRGDKSAYGTEVTVVRTFQGVSDLLVIWRWPLLGASADVTGFRR